MLKTVLVVLLSGMALQTSAQTIPSAGADCLKSKDAYSALACVAAGEQAITEKRYHEAARYFEHGADAGCNVCLAKLGYINLFYASDLCENRQNCVEKGLKASKQACSAKDGEACFWYATQFFARKDRESVTKAARWNRLACEYGFATGCEALATDLQFLQGGVVNGEVIAAHFKGCQIADNSLACIELGAANVPTISQWAYLRSCKAGNAASCFKIAEKLEKTAFEANSAFIRQTYEKVCYSNAWPYGKKQACDKLKNLK